VIVSTAEPDVDVTGIALQVDTTATLELRRQMKSARGT
jgi:hypothetical protein